MKNFSKNLASITLLVILGLLFAPLAMAATCADINTSYHSPTNGEQAPGGAVPANGTSLNPPTPPAPGSALDGKLVVFTEEPLGTADGNFTLRCARQVVCTGADASTKANPPAGSKPLLIRKCATTYVAPTACTATAADELATKLSAGPTLGAAGKYTTCEQVMIYISPAGTNLLYQYVGKIYTYMASIGGVIAVLIMIVAGILRATAGDRTEQVTQANKLMTKCISGLVLLFLSAIILYTINPNFFVNTQATSNQNPAVGMATPAAPAAP